jgi:phosphoenolpyruvate carboxylase
MDELRAAYREWPLFTALLDNAEMSLAKTDRPVAERYLALGDRPDLTERILAELDLATSLVLEVLDVPKLLASRRILSAAVDLRNPYVDALSNLSCARSRRCDAVSTPTTPKSSDCGSSCCSPSTVCQQVFRTPASTGFRGRRRPGCDRSG